MDYVQNKDDQAVILDRVKDSPIADADPNSVVEPPTCPLLTAARSGLKSQPPNSPVHSIENLTILS